MNAIEATLIVFGTPDADGRIFAPGCLAAATNVPVVLEFDPAQPVGRADVTPDGRVVVHLSEGVDPRVAQMEPEIGYRVLREAPGSGADVRRRIEQVEIITIGMVQR